MLREGIKRKLMITRASAEEKDYNIWGLIHKFGTRQFLLIIIRQVLEYLQNLRICVEKITWSWILNKNPLVLFDCRPMTRIFLKDGLTRGFSSTWFAQPLLPSIFLSLPPPHSCCSNPKRSRLNKVGGLNPVALYTIFYYDLIWKI